MHRRLALWLHWMAEQVRLLRHIRFADGIGIGCVYDFSLSQSIQFTSATGIVSVAYAALPGALSGASGTVTSSLDFVQTLGTPPVELIVSTAAGSAVPAGGNSGSISLNPSGFVMTAVDQSVEYPESTGEASVTVSITLEEDLKYRIPE